MATITLTQTLPANSIDDNNIARSLRVVSWAPMVNGDVGSATSFFLAHYRDRAVQVFGTFGTGGTVTMQGSMDGTNWATLHDPQGNALTFTAAGIKEVAEVCPYVRPSITAGDGTTSLTVLATLSQGHFNVL